MKIVLFQSSDTQRVAINIEKKDSLLISKEWRRNTNEDWKIGKSIEIPHDKLESVQKVLSEVNNYQGKANTEELVENLKKCGVFLDD